ncbi:MAG TPA: hypothetical protein VFO86_07060, partial [Terriglobia bacterium]|nr:hypothetical protein [Terriglobia bacterium]
AIIEYIALKGNMSGIDLKVITELAQYYEKEIGTHLAPNYPFVGKDFNTTRAGIHAGGLRKFEQIYNIFDTTTLLNRPPKVSITDKSGTDGVALWVNEFLGLKGDERLSVMKVAKIQRWVMDQYEQGGRMSSITDEELEEQVKTQLPEYYQKYHRN